MFKIWAENFSLKILNLQREKIRFLDLLGKIFKNIFCVKKFLRKYRVVNYNKANKHNQMGKRNKVNAIFSHFATSYSALVSLDRSVLSNSTKLPSRAVQQTRTCTPRQETV